MLRTTDLLAPLRDFVIMLYPGISPEVGDQLRGRLVATSTGLTPASLTRLIWTHAVTLVAGLTTGGRAAAFCYYLFSRGLATVRRNVIYAPAKGCPDRCIA